MKLSEIAKNIIQEHSASFAKEILTNECSHFINNNRQLLKDEFYLMRGTEFTGNLDKRDYRERKKIRGSAYLYFLFETMRSSSMPSRKSLVPCTGGEVSSLFNRKAVYAVFPIGSNYEMVYTKGIEDFNQNDLNNEVYKVMDPFTEIKMEYYNTMGNKREMDQETFKDIGYVIGEVEHLIDSKKPDNIIKGYKYLFDYLEEDREDLEKEIPEIYDQLEEAQKYMNEILQKTEVTKKLKQNMDGLEVGLYAPDGFIYVLDSFINKIDWSS